MEIKPNSQHCFPQGSASVFLDGLEVSVDSVLGPGTEGRPVAV